MTGVKMTSIMKGIEDQLKSMVDRANAPQAYLNRVVYRQYQNAQRKRWITENESETGRWKDLSPAYAARKAIAFAAYPGKGTKILIATDRLRKAVVGPGEEHRKITTPKSIEIGWTTPYAVYVDAERQFSEFGEKTLEEMYSGLGNFVMQGLFRDLGDLV